MQWNTTTIYLQKSNGRYGDEDESLKALTNYVWDQLLFSIILFVASKFGCVKIVILFSFTIDDYLSFS
jgi:hypothetical protein